MRPPKDWEVIKKIDDSPINPYGTVAWCCGDRRSYRQIRKELLTKYPESDGYRILIAKSKIE